jgi:hypothetical protein
MRSLLLIFLSWLILLPASAASVVQAQQSFQNVPSPDQWLSHQMNQPPPDVSDKTLSQERLDELRQLYDMAKQEAEAKTVKKVPDKK